MVDTSLEVDTISWVLIPVDSPKTSCLVRSAITISSKLALPARSPNPLIVHSTCLAPPSKAAIELATANPKSS